MLKQLLVDSVETIRNGTSQEALPDAPALSRRDTAPLALFFVGLLAVCLMAANVVSLAAAVLWLAVAVRKESLARLKANLSLPAVGLAALLLICCLSGAFSMGSAAAVKALCRSLAALAAAAAVLLRFDRRHLPALLWGFAAVTAVYSLLCVDAGTTRWVWAPLCSLAELCGADLAGLSPVVSGHLAGLAGESGVLAGLTALAVIAGAWLQRTAQTPLTRFLAALLLGINAMTFGFSRRLDAIVCLAVALIVWILLTKKGKRIRFFLLMLLCALMTTILTAVTWQKLGSASYAPLLCTVLCGPAFFLLDELLSARIIEAFSELHHDFNIILRVGALMWIVVLLFYFFAAFSLEYAYTFSGDEVITRVVELDAGTHAVKVDMDEGVKFTVSVIDEDHMAMPAAWETVYDSTVGGDSFLVPEGTGRIEVKISGLPETTIRYLILSEDGWVSLNYPMLPDSIAHRMHSKPLTSTAFLLRIQYVKDALKIWRSAPLFGQGLDATQTLYSDVQPFPYDADFARSHIPQYLAETGIVGTLCFLLAAVGLLVLLVRKWRRNRDPLAAAFIVLLVMMQLHSLMEMNFSVHAYAIPAYFLMAAAAVFCGREPLPEQDALPAEASVPADGE